MAASEGTVVRAERTAGRLADSRLAAPAVFAAALGVYGLVSLGLPLQAGRDLARYLLDYAQLFDAHVVFPNALLARTPGTPLVTGVLLEAGPVAAETGAALLYALSLVAWFCIARRFGALTALATAAAMPRPSTPARAAVGSSVARTSSNATSANAAAKSASLAS